MPVQYGLIGKSLSHSFSKRYFSEKFGRESIDAQYELYELTDISEFPDLIKSLPTLRGLNVTIPYKAEVIPYLDWLSHEAETVGAVNTIRREADGKLSGHNSDIYGFRDSVLDLLHGHEPEAALILGTGGAGKAVAYTLKRMLGVDDLLWTSRKPAGNDQVSYAELAKIDWSKYSLIVNTTPLGMYPKIDATPDLPWDKLSAKHYIIDLIYNPAETKLMKLAAERGAKTCNGLDMLIGQAEKSWEIWQNMDEQNP